VVGSTAGLAAVAGVSERAEVIMADGDVNLDEIQEQVLGLVEGMDLPTPDFDADIEEIKPTEEELSESEDIVEDAPSEEITDYNTWIGRKGDERGSEFILLAEEVKDALTSNQRTKIMSQGMTGEWPVSVVIEQITRTMGIGLTEEYKTGKTIEGKIEGTDIDVSIIASSLKHSNFDELESGMTIYVNCVVKEYRAGLKRFELLE